jgi:DNA polymerase III delta subunit
MTRRQLTQFLKNGEADNRYLLVGDEPILIDRALKDIKDTLKIEESFDMEYFSLSDGSLEDIVSKLYLVPLKSAKRLLVVKNLENVSDRELDDFANVVRRNRSSNCLVLIYQMKKDARKPNVILKRLDAVFLGFSIVLVGPEPGEVKKWIREAIRRDNLNLNNAMVNYLEHEFSNDITGLKYELEKIGNYLHEAGTIDAKNMKDLAQGLCNFDLYQMVDAFLDGRSEVLSIFEELQPYLQKNAVVVDALTRGIAYRAVGRNDLTGVSKTKLQEILKQLIAVDRRIKTSSIFTRLLVELFFLRNAGTFRNGAQYGR